MNYNTDQNGRISSKVQQGHFYLGVKPHLSIGLKAHSIQGTVVHYCKANICGWLRYRPKKRPNYCYVSKPKYLIFIFMQTEVSPPNSFVYLSFTLFSLLLLGFDSENERPPMDIDKHGLFIFAVRLGTSF